MRPLLSRRRGFTLIEALAAFTIMALVMAQLLHGISLGAANERRADFLLRATREGSSQLAALGVEKPLVSGETAGRYGDGLVWTLEVSQDRRVSDPSGSTIAIGYRVRLEIRTEYFPVQKLDLAAEKILAPKSLEGRR